MFMVISQTLQKQPKLMKKKTYSMLNFLLIKSLKK